MGALVGGGIATLLSLLVLSRAIADNPLYRFAQYLLVGVALGYVAAILVNQVLTPPVGALIAGQASAQTLVTLGGAAVLLLLLATRFGHQRLSYLASVPLAALFGVGAALALIGAARGTIVPQLLDTVALRRLLPADLASGFGALALVAAVVVTLAAFTYAQRGEQPSAAGRSVRRLGRALVLITFGVFLAQAVTTYIAALVAQLQLIADWLTLVVNQF
jgi:hypothetical protein